MGAALCISLWGRAVLSPKKEWGLSPMGHGHPREGSTSPAGCGRRHSHLDQREALSPVHWRRGPGSKGLFIFPTSRARVAQGPRGLRPALTRAWAWRPLTSPKLTLGHTVASLPLLCWHRAKPLAGPGSRPCSHLQPLGAEVPAGSGTPGSTGQE